MRPIQLSGCVILKGQRQNRKLLLLFRKKHKHYEFPGGKVNDNETLIEAAIRETKEEIGCDVALLKYLGYAQFKIDGCIFQSHKYLAKIKSGQKPIIGEPEAFDELMWLPIKDYGKYVIAPNVRMFCESLLEGKIII